MLMENLDIASIRELEDLIIDAIYQDVLQGKLDQREQQFEVEYTMGRDLEHDQLQKLLATLDEWCVSTLFCLLLATDFRIWECTVGLHALAK